MHSPTLQTNTKPGQLGCQRSILEVRGERRRGGGGGGGGGGEGEERGEERGEGGGEEVEGGRG